MGSIVPESSILEQKSMVNNDELINEELMAILKEIVHPAQILIEEVEAKKAKLDIYEMSSKLNKEYDILKAYLPTIKEMPTNFQQEIQKNNASH